MADDAQPLVAGFALDRQLAELAGWRMVERGRNARLTRIWQLIDPQGNFGSDAYCDSEETAWFQIWNRGKCPFYSLDLNATFELLKQMPLGAVYLDEDGLTWCCTSYRDGSGLLADAEAETPELAICAAFLQFAASKGQTHGRTTKTADHTETT